MNAIGWRVKLLPTDKILDSFKLEAFADNNLNVIIFFFFLRERERERERERVEHIVGKGKKAGNIPEFLIFLSLFSMFPKINFNFSVSFILSSAKALSFKKTQNFKLFQTFLI